MPRGGARVNSGPPPDPEALRRERPSDRDGWTDLPSEGRQGEPPPWPLRAWSPIVEGDDLFAATYADGWAEREAEIWDEIWSTPQAVAWERLGWTHEIALYTRLLALAETGEPKAITEARQWSDRLGLNPAAMLRNRWRVARDQLAEKRAVAEPATPAKGSKAPADARARLRARSGGRA